MGRREIGGGRRERLGSRTALIVGCLVLCAGGGRSPDDLGGICCAFNCPRRDATLVWGVAIPTATYLLSKGEFMLITTLQIILKQLLVDTRDNDLRSRALIGQVMLIYKKRAVTLGR